jgi:predicted DsbA family dithiol-disulfide isomerase
VEVERLRQEYDLQIDFAPFLLRPDTPPEGAPRQAQSAGAPPSPVEQRGENLGLTFRRGRTLTSNSHLALEAAEFALEYGDPWRFHRRMFKAYFEDLDDIGKIENVVRIGADAGLDAASLQAALEDGRYRQRVDEGIAWSRQIGVTAIPTFIFDERLAVVGAHELPTFRDVMAQLAATAGEDATPEP